MNIKKECLEAGIKDLEERKGSLLKNREEIGKRLQSIELRIKTNKRLLEKLR